MISEHEIITYPDNIFQFVYKFRTKQKCEKDSSHWHEDLEFIYVTSGDGIISIDDEQIIATAGDLVIINSNCIHCIEALYDNVEYYYFNVGINFLENFGFDLDLFYPKTEISNKYIIDKFQNIIYMIQNKTLNYKISVKIEILSIILYIYNQSSPHILANDKQNSKRLIIRDSIKYLKSNFSKTISVEEVAKHVGLNKFYFCHAFKDIVGKTMLEYLNLLRINHAVQLLAHSNLNVSQISFECGFEVPSYFIKVFKKKFGLTPLEYRKQIAKANIVNITEKHKEL